MVYYENVRSTFGGLGKVVNRKSDAGEHVLIEERRYFLGIKYKDTSRIRTQSLLDVWSAISGKF